ncbi:MAG: circularly permuted type 2 ATP-grasp protein [Bryobacterales bacterium]|nr:circularly permuted type 2 ATP-grasp protein [Bryobacterales bacterium]
MNDRVTTSREAAEEWAYHPPAFFYDEMMAPSGLARPHWQPLLSELASMGQDQFHSRWVEGQRLLHSHGVTYNVYDDPQSISRPWPLDPIPFVLEKNEWNRIEAAIEQRATLLNTILSDLYGPQRLLREHQLPAELIHPHPAFLRACHGFKPARGIYLHSYSADLARSPDGNWWVIADRTQAPSGAGYALENRLVASRMLPDVFDKLHVQRLATFFQTYRDTLRSLVPANRENPRIVLLTPGPYNETYFEHALLARYLGFTLVEGGDLTVRDNRVFLKTLGGLLPVDVIVRRQDDSFCDPLELREDSMLGVAGLVQAVRSGNCAIANALGSGLLETAAPAAFLPGLCRHLLDEDLKMPTIATWWCGQPGPFSYVASNLQNLVIKPTFPRPDTQPVFGAKLNASKRRALLDRMLAQPDRFVAQEQVSLSTVPVWENGRLDPRHFVLRVYAVANGDSYSVMPGGLTRVSNSLDSLVVSMQRGGGSKDTWVMADHPASEFSLLRPARVAIEVSRATFDLPSRVADNLFWLGRYMERLEAAVRVSRAMLRRLSQETVFSAHGGLQAGEQVLLALGYLKAESAPDKRAATLEKELLSLIFDVKSTRAFGATTQQIRRVAWLLRDRISIDAWRILSRFERQFNSETPRDALRLNVAQEILDQAVVTLSAFAGTVMEGMTRGDGWRFLDIGRRLERALQMTELLRAGLASSGETGGGQLDALLDMTDSTLTYRSRYLSSMQADLLLDLVLLDEANPRSVAFQTIQLAEHIDQLPATRELVRRPAEARIALSLRNMLQLADVGDLVRADGEGNWTNLDTLLMRVAGGLRDLSETLTRVYFNHAIASRQLSAP